MPTPTKGARLGGGPAHERLILSNLATQLFQHGRITTTEAKAKRLRPYAEKLVTTAKRGDLHARRTVAKVIRDKGVLHVLFTEVAPRYINRNGGYTRIIKLNPRQGDNAPMAIIELVEPLAEAVVAEAKAATKRAAKDAEAKAPKAKAQITEVAPVEEGPVEAAVEAEVAAEEAVAEVVEETAEEVAAVEADDAESANEEDTAEDAEKA